MSILDRLLPFVPEGLIRRVYSMGPLARIARRLLTPAPSADPYRWVTVSHGPLAGLRLRLDLRREKTYWLGTYEPGVEAALTNRLRPGDTAFDVGAYVGYLALLMAHLVGPEGRVVAFEAHPDALSRLNEHIHANKTRHVRSVGLALSDRQGTAWMSSPPGMDPRENSIRRADQPAGKVRSSAGAVRVRTDTLDHWLARNPASPPRLLKIDIEGVGGQALAGSRHTLRRHRPDLIVEIHSATDGALVWSILSPLRYRMTNLENGRPTRAAPYNGHLLAIHPDYTRRGDGRTA
ncbi:MAG: FkbM family methyltransferase [Nitrospirae bacterium]|nr:FkbM family methyltransferase [Nitrospirota bacterium]